ncbi:MAG: DUF2203 domain-containing protein [Candidatus Omnitrophica bacterium]|nr:DUF2203 domain-containing protein [Candidatus Omnitrophota bacterium]MDE2223096.1 DUF2203 domain-containing protein [Candidatus Omnitrophota bacterium]
MIDRFFTPSQANQTLPLVKGIVEDIIAKAGQARRLMTQGEITPEHEDRLKALDQDIKGLMKRLEEIGCYYKDWNFEIGLVDFPAIIHGQEALLCWRSDEPEVAWFHGLQDGYAGRHPITKELIFS